jgi:hypothetical protein
MNAQYAIKPILIQQILNNIISIITKNKTYRSMESFLEMFP